MLRQNFEAIGGETFVLTIEKLAWGIDEKVYYKNTIQMQCSDKIEEFPVLAI